MRRMGKAFAGTIRLAAAACLAAAGLWAQDLAAEAWRLDLAGRSAEAEERLRTAAERAPGDIAAQRSYAAFLDRHRSPLALQAYARLAELLQRAGAPAAERAAVAQRLAELELLAGNRSGAEQRLAEFAAAGGTGLSLANAAASPEAAREYIEIPGPLASFARMAALSPQLRPEEILPALARNVVINGYRAYSANEALEQTEFLSLIFRYLTQARELEKIAAETGGVLRIEQCESARTAVLLRVIGYRMRGGCGAEVVLETVNASRAFLTTDSGFPLGELELALRTNRPFEWDYRPSRIPLLYTRDYWQPAKDQAERPFIDYFLSDPSLCRLYLALSKIDRATADALQRKTPAARLKLYAHVLDFFGSMFEIRDGRAMVPGGARTERVWAELNGVSPEKGVDFYERLLMQDDGWLASFYDAVARIEGPVQQYLLEPSRLERFYLAIRGRVTTPGPARPVFRSNTDMLLLTARLRLDPGGRPHLPGGIEVWKKLFADPPKGTKYDNRIKRAAPGWKDPDDVLEALFGLSRKMAENEPLKIFMALTDLDRRRQVPLDAATTTRLIEAYPTMSPQYSLFAEVPTVSSSTILAFLDTAERINKIRNQTRRADTAGIMQALASLWQILVRHGAIPAEKADATLAALLAPFAAAGDEPELFDAGRAGVRTLLSAASAPQEGSLQEHMLDLLAGTASPAGSDAYQVLVQDLIRIFEAQRLVPLDTLFQLADHLERVARGEPFDAALAGRLASRVSEIQLPQSSLTRAERNASAFGYWTEQHIDDQRRFNLRRDIERAGGDARKLADLRGALAPFLRDTLVGFVYMHYAPPGAQVLLTNPLFVRSHDFLGLMGSEQTWKETAVYGTGWPRNAGGRLVGSLASLPYALAEAEQNFLIPIQEQALIWGDLVPQMMLTAVVPRWWNVSPAQIRWVGLHTAYGESVLAQAAMSEVRRAEVLAALRSYIAPRRLQTVRDLLAAGQAAEAAANVLPSELYMMARRLAPADQSSPLADSIRRLAAEATRLVSEEAISRTFGTPKPTLANSYQQELLHLRTFPTLMGYSSRILAESWESNLLFFAALADQIHAEPVELNVLVPRWTQRTAESIFATHLEDWPALLRSLRKVGQEVLEEAGRSLQAGLATGGNAQ